MLTESTPHCGLYSDGQHLPDSEYSQLASKIGSIVFIKFVMNEDSGLVEQFSDRTVVFYRGGREVTRINRPKRFFGEIEETSSVASKKQKTSATASSVGSSIREVSRLASSAPCSGVFHT